MVESLYHGFGPSLLPEPPLSFPRFSFIAPKFSHVLEWELRVGVPVPAQRKLTLSNLASTDFLRIPRDQVPSDGTHDQTPLDNCRALRSKAELAHRIL